MPVLPAPRRPAGSRIRALAGRAHPLAGRARSLAAAALAGRARALAAAALAAAVAACALPAGGSVPPGSTAAAPPTASPATSAGSTGGTRPFRPTPTPAPTFATYVVRSGDTLTGLARRFGTTPESLAYWNRARYPSLDPDSPAYRPDRIDAGWELAYVPGGVVDPEDLPPASVAPAATGPAEGAGPFPTLPADGSAALVRRGPAGLPGVALTFEYAGGPAAAAAGAGPEAVVQWLEANDVPATVFAAATAAGDATGTAVLARLAAAASVRAGLLAPVTDPAGLAAALGAADATLAARLGASTAPFLRPSAGSAGADALRAAGTAGWRWVVTWDVDPGDGVAPENGGPIAADIVARVVSRASGGSIIRLRLGGPRTLEALPGILDGLAARGLSVVPLEAVLGPDAGG